LDQRFYDAVLASPVIAAVKDPAQLEDCLALENIQVVFLLFGDLQGRWTIVGAMIVVGSGLFLLAQDTRRRPA